MDSHVKNILVVCHHYPPHITGVGTVANNQAKYLSKLGHKVTVITSDTAYDEKSCVIDNVNVIRIKALNFMEKFNAPFPIFSIKIFSVLLKNIKKSDIVHIHDGFYISSFLAALIAKFYKKPLVLTQHVSWVVHPSRFVIFAEKIVYSTTGALIFLLSDIIITYNDRVEEFLIDKGVSKHKLIRLINGVDTNFFHKVDSDEKKLLKSKFGLNENKKTILFVGRFVHKKGFDKLLKSQSDEYQLVFVGGDAIEKNTDKVVFLGKLSQEEISKIYQASDIFILPSESEGFPLSIQEAMASGLPIITVKDEGYQSYDLDPNLFYMLDNPTILSISDAIKSIYSDEDRLQKMSDYSIDYAHRNFSWLVTTNLLNNIYEDLLSRSKGGKKIAFISDAVYLFNKGGKEKRLFDISQRLSSAGYDVTIYCMKWWDGDKIFKKDGITYHAISPYYPLYYNERRSIKQAILFALNCFKLLNKSFDVIDIDHIPHLVLFTTKIVCIIRGKEMIVTWHEVWGRKYWKTYLGPFTGFIAYNIEKLSSKLPNKIISVSNRTTSDLRSILEVKKEIVTIPNGINLDVIRGSQLSEKISDVIFAGRLLSNKNIDILLKSISVLKKRNILTKVFIIGEGPEKEKLEKLSKNLQISEIVTFLGFINNHSDLYSIIKSSKVFVLPSSREGFGIAVIEANACGVPVITVNSEHNAAKDLIINGENGSVCDLNENALADTIKKILDTRKDSNFYTKFSDKFDWINVFPAMEKIYK